jgi:hypothetical protein
MMQSIPIVQVISAILAVTSNATASVQYSISFCELHKLKEVIVQASTWKLRTNPYHDMSRWALITKPAMPSAL